MSLGELYALGLRNNWGEKRLNQIDIIKQNFTIIDINIDPIIHRYADIDAFSQGKHPTMPTNSSSRTMGKNDLWIAATTMLFNATLLTNDDDFIHLSPQFFKVEKVKFEPVY